jgi:hypothetical protein
MVEFSERTQANMDVVLEEVCAELPNGGDHESRKFIAEQLIQCARSGRTTWVTSCTPRAALSFNWRGTSVRRPERHLLLDTLATASTGTRTTGGRFQLSGTMARFTHSSSAGPAGVKA